MITILLNHISRASGRKYRQISSGIQAAIAAGSLQPGDRLPPQRQLADALGVTLGTVTRAYREIDELGLVKGEIGRGTYVARREEDEFTLHALHNRLDRETAGCIRFDLNFPVPEGTPDLAALLAVLSRQPALDEMLCYQPTAGLSRHRRAAGRWLDRFHMPTSPDQIAITTGAQHALFVALASQLSPGDALAVDCYTYPGIINLAGVLHIRLVPVEGDAEGMRPEALAKAAARHRLKGVYLIPTMHNPTTITSGTERRRELAAVLRRLDLLLIEDDVYGGMEQKAQTPIATLIPERSFYLTNLSKTLAPGLRLGFLAVPEGQLSAVERVMAASIWMNPPLTAEIGSRWIDDGTADRVIISKRQAAEKRMAILADKLVGQDLHFRPGSLHGWLKLPPPWTGETFARQAAALGVQVIPSANFSTGSQQLVEGVRICIGPPKNEAEVTRGSTILATILAKPTVRTEPFM
jgi:DNA-binding transcriptional MocR family regulator